MNLRSFLLLASGLLFFCCASRAAVTISSSTHSSLATHDFSDETIPFAPYQKSGGVASGAHFEIENGALKITNKHAGSFGVDLKVSSFDAERYSHLFFDYVLAPDVKVNIFFRYNGIYHGVVFSGPKEVRAGSILLGHIKNVTADGKRHRAHVPLREWLRKLYPTQTQFKIDEIIVGNWDNTNYLMAGIGGNGPGATWKMDDFVLAGAGPEQAKFEIKTDDGKPVTEYSWSLDDRPAASLNGNEIAPTVSDGVHILHIFDKAKKPVAAYGFYVASSGPRAGTPELKNNLLRVPLSASAGLDFSSLKLSVAGRAFQLDSPYLSWDESQGVLTLDAADAGFEWNDNQQIPVALEGLRDTLGRSGEAVKIEVPFQFETHKSAPPLPRLESLKEMGEGTFEDSLDGWTPRTENDGAAVIERDAATAAGGKYSLRLTCPTHAANFGAWVRRAPFDVAKYPAIEFDYRVPENLRVDFLIEWNGAVYSISFTDRTPGYPRLGAIENVVLDEKWHHARFDLLAAMRAMKPNATSFRANWLAVMDSGYLGNGRGTQYWIDNFHWVPVVPGAPFESRVLAPDVAGLKALSWSLDENPDTQPPTEGQAGQSLQARGAGRRWLHLRAQNKAGQWSATNHLPLWLDAAPPALGEPLPARGAKTSVSLLQIPLSDDVGLDFSSLNLNVQGREYSLRDEMLRYENKNLTFDLELALQSERLQPVTDGAKVAWALKGVRDMAGQAVPDASGEWMHDFASDKTGPRARLVSSTHSVAARYDFQNGVPWVGENVTLTAVPRENAGEGNLALRATTTMANAPYAVRMHYGWDIARAPMVGFFYKIPAGVNLALRVRQQNKISDIKIVGEIPNAAGEFASIIADNQWRWASLNVGAIANKLGTGPTQMIEFVDPTARTAIGVVWEIDDFTIQHAPAAGNINLSWRAHDISGVPKYRVAWDQKPDTTPTEETSEATREIAPAPGTWWAHVQAQDGAGNWGPVAHLPLLLP